MSSLDFGAMLAGASLVQAQWPLRAQITWARILDKPTDVEFLREGVLLDPQTVRIGWDDITSDANDSSGNSTMRVVTIFGVRGHPDIDDLDVQRWDTFVKDEVEYTVTSVNKELIGQIQAECEAVG